MSVLFMRVRYYISVYFATIYELKFFFPRNLNRIHFSLPRALSRTSDRKIFRSLPRTKNHHSTIALFSWFSVLVKALYLIRLKR